MNMERFRLPEEMSRASREASSERESEERFYDLLETLVPQLRERWERELEEKVGTGEMDFSQACRKIESVIAEREKALYHSYTPVTKGSFDWMEIPLESEKLNSTVERLLSSRLEENLLGSGAVAKVYRVENTESICVKVVENEQTYRMGNTIFQESQFLEDLSDYEVDGVRTPHFIQCFSGGRMNAIVMEEIRGASLEQIMNGDEGFPEQFDFSDFFARLKRYFEALHRKNYFHLDIAPRNIMVDRETGLPVVIDFGKAKHFQFSEEVTLEAERDLAGFEAVKAETKNFLGGKSRKGSIDKKSFL